MSFYSRSEQSSDSIIIFASYLGFNPIALKIRGKKTKKNRI